MTQVGKMDLIILVADKKMEAANVSFNSCMDPAFAKFKTTLQKWFGEE